MELSAEGRNLWGEYLVVPRRLFEDAKAEVFGWSQVSESQEFS